MRDRLRPLGDAWQPWIDRALERLASPALPPPPAWSEATRRESTLAQLRRLLDLVVLWNQRVDLTAAREPGELVDLYLADALVLAGTEPVSPARVHWVDVGSGAGAPGLVLQLLRPDLQLTLVEPRAKRVAFLRTALGTLQLRAQLVERRSDALAEGSAEVAVSRATFPPDVWLAEGARLARSAVWVLLARGDAPALQGWHVAQEVSYEWPLTRAARRALCFVPGERP